LGRLTRRFGAGAASVGLVLTLLSTPAAALAHPPLLLGLNLLPPIGAPDSYTTPYETRLDIDKPGVLVNDTDLDSSTLYAELVSSTSHGTLELREEGRIRYQPDNGFSGTDTFTYRPYDGTFYAVLAVTVTITVKPGPTPTPKPTATLAPTPTPTPSSPPAATPTPAPTPTPTPRPTTALPTLPLPTVPLPTIGLPGLPTPTPTMPPSGTDPTPAPAASVAPTAASTPDPDSSTVPFQRPGPTGSTDPAAVAVVAATTGGNGPMPPSGLSVAPPELAGGPSGAGAGPIAFGPFGTVGLGIEWVVPTALLTVPGFLLLVVALAQIFGGLVWLPVVRRRLRGDGRETETHPARLPH
jgi:hypothetical protein